MAGETVVHTIGFDNSPAYKALKETEKRTQETLRGLDRYAPNLKGFQNGIQQIQSKLFGVSAAIGGMGAAVDRAYQGYQKFNSAGAELALMARNHSRLTFSIQAGASAYDMLTQSIRDAAEAERFRLEMQPVSSQDYISSMLYGIDPRESERAMIDTGERQRLAAAEAKRKNEQDMEAKRIREEAQAEMRGFKRPGEDDLSVRDREEQARHQERLKRIYELTAIDERSRTSLAVQERARYRQVLMEIANERQARADAIEDRRRQDAERAAEQQRREEQQLIDNSERIRQAMYDERMRAQEEQARGNAWTGSVSAPTGIGRANQRQVLGGRGRSVEQNTAEIGDTTKKMLILLAKFAGQGIGGAFQ